MRIKEDPSHTKIAPALERINNIQISDSIEQFITEVVEKLSKKIMKQLLIYIFSG